MLSLVNPRWTNREAPSQPAEFNYKHKKQTGGAGQYAHIVGTLEPLPSDAEGNFLFENRTVGGSVPKEYIPGVEKGLQEALLKGP